MESGGILLSQVPQVLHYLNETETVCSFPRYERSPFTLLAIDAKKIYLIFKKKKYLSQLNAGSQSTLTLAVDILSREFKVYYRLKLTNHQARVDEVNERRVRDQIAQVDRVLHFEAVHYYTSLNGVFKRGAIAPYYPQGDLEKALMAGRLAFCQKEKIIKELMKVVYALHQKGVVHRDLKPANILLSQDLTPIVADFGIALVCDGNQLREKVAGTPLFKAPDPSVGFSNDIWSLGVLFFKLIKGFYPFSLRNKEEALLSQTFFENLDRKNPWDNMVFQMLTIDSKQRIKADQLVKNMKNLN